MSSDRWAQVGLGVMLAGCELQPRVFRLDAAGTSVVRSLLLVFTALVPLALGPLRSTRLVAVLTRPPLGWVLAFLAWTCTAAIWSVSPTHAVQPAIWIVASTLYAVWFVSVHGWLRFRMTVALAGTSFIAAGVAYHFAFAEAGRFQGLTAAATVTGRIGGITAVVGGSLMARDRRCRIVGAAALAAGLYAVVASSTRTVAGALVVIAIFALVRRSGRSSVLGVTLVVIALTVAFVFAARGGIVVVSQTPQGIDFVEERNGILVLQHSPGGDEYLTGTGRTLVWSSTWDMITRRPIVGWGTGSSERVFEELAKRGTLNWHANTAHNTVLQTALTNGLVGVALLLAIAASYRRVASRSPDLTRSSLVILLVITSVGESLLDTGRVPLLILAACVAAAANDAFESRPLGWAVTRHRASVGSLPSGITPDVR